MKCKAVRCIYYNAGNGYTVASYVTEETLPKEVSSQKNGRYGMFMAIGNELPTEDGLEPLLPFQGNPCGLQENPQLYRIKPF